VALNQFSKTGSSRAGHLPALAIPIQHINCLSVLSKTVVKIRREALGRKKTG